MMLDVYNFPTEIRSMLANYEVLKDMKGRIGDRIVKLANQNDHTIYIKIGRSELVKTAIKCEAEILRLLDEQHIQVPDVILYECHHETAYLLLSEIKGLNAHQAESQFSKKEIVELSAHILKKINSFDLLVPMLYKDTLATELSKIANDIKRNGINTVKFERANHGKSVEEVYSYLYTKRAIINSNVFTHGDFCLPNILITSKEQWGVIDWAQAGIGDRYRDLLPMAKSISRNFGESYVQFFFECYGMPEIDKEKLLYYDLIDQFSYYKIYDKI